MTDYHCPKCKSTHVKAYEFKQGRRVHIYCCEESCEWMHRGLSVGVFQEGGSEYQASR